MAPRRSSKSKKSTSRKQKEATSVVDHDTAGTKFSAVPWSQDPLTDRMLLPRTVGGVYTTRKISIFNSYLTQQSTVATYGAMNWTLSGNVTDYSSLAAVFDQYRILAVEVVFRPAANTSAVYNNSKGLLSTVLDYDDSTALTAVGQALAYENCISTPMYLAQRRCLKPRVAVAIYGSSAFTSYGNVEAPWIDCASPSVNHYGLKFSLDAGNSSDLQVFDVVVTTIVQFRATR
jgi:hypothetical protein